ncbi:MAG: hypothetical protein J6T92_04905, partial [Ottowia sp.]|nr:hypothetical protein [Ottowia sp.]
IAGGSGRIFGLMVESNIQPGAQKFTPEQDSVQALEYGKSITDACLGWDDSAALVRALSEAVLARRECRRAPAAPAPEQAKPRKRSGRQPK